MAVNTMPQKRFKYIIDNNGTETELDIDPKGWDGHEVGFERSEDFGLNIQNVVPLSFSGAGRTLLKGVYESKGIFGRTRTLIEKRQNDWTYAPFYAYKHDYSTYKDNLRYIEIAGIEDGLAKKFDTYKDTEYEIYLTVNDKVFIDYTGAKYTTENQIQAKYGQLEEKNLTGEDYYILGGARAVRAYNNKIAFTDSEGLPYETMTFRATQTASIDLTLELKITIEADAAIGQTTPNQGQIIFIEHASDFSIINELYSYNPNSSTTPANNRIDTFSRTENITLNVVSGRSYSIFYKADDKSYDEVTVTDGANCYINISNIVDSAYQNSKLEAFTYEWLIEKLLLKIDNTATFVSTVSYPNVTELISATPCIKNMGNPQGSSGIIKTTLKDVLESFNKLKCIAIDITGNVITISDRSAAYPKLIGDSYGLITVNNIVVEHSTEHQYNKITVGADTDDREDDDPLVYPFICKKEFSVEDTIAENELDLVNNFMLDPYAIDKYIIDTLTSEDNKDECKFVVFASILNTNFSLDSTDGDWVNSDTKNISEEACISTATQTVTLESYGSIKFGFSTFSTDAPTVLYDTTARIQIYQGLTPIYLETFSVNPNQTVTEFTIDLDAGTYDISIIVETPYNPAYNDVVTNTSNILGYNEDDYMLIEYNGNAIYRGHDKPIIGFSGDSDTIYNIPLTPKRILNNWINYLAISVVGKDTKELKYGTATILNSAITSKCDYEAASVEENANLSLTSVTPLFLPTTISADTDEAILDIDTFETDKYKYFSLKDEKTNKTYQGWINSVTFALAKNKSKQIMLQAKSI